MQDLGAEDVSFRHITAGCQENVEPENSKDLVLV